MNVSNNRYATLAVRLLLDRTASADRAQWQNVDWADFLRLAQKNVIVIRSYDALNRLGVEIEDENYAKAVQSERKRIKKVVEAMGLIGRACADLEIKHVMLKSFQHYPDMGGDIDLLILDASHELDDHLITNFKARKLTRNFFFNFISGKSDLVLDSYQISVEVHRGRMGYAGEYGRYPAILSARCTKVAVDGFNIPVPSPEDQFLMHVLQRMYGHFYIRISDFVGSVKLIQRADLDWGYIIETSRALGILEGVNAYLGFVNEIYKEATGEQIELRHIEGIAVSERYRGVSFHGTYYRYPLLPVTAGLYLAKAKSDLLSGKFASVARLCLVPSVGALHIARNVVGRRSRIFD